MLIVCRDELGLKCKKLNRYISCFHMQDKTIFSPTLSNVDKKWKRFLGKIKSKIIIEQ